MIEQTKIFFLRGREEGSGRGDGGVGGGGRRCGRGRGRGFLSAYMHLRRIVLGSAIVGDLAWGLVNRPEPRNCCYCLKVGRPPVGEFIADPSPPASGKQRALPTRLALQVSPPCDSLKFLITCQEISASFPGPLFDFGRWRTCPGDEVEGFDRARRRPCFAKKVDLAVY